MVGEGLGRGGSLCEHMDVESFESGNLATEGTDPHDPPL